MDLRQASASGYTQSKLVSEYIVQRAAEDFGAAACNLRIGQIIGDLKLGLWNENEAPPSMVRSALTLKKLPALDMVGYQCNSWTAPRLIPLLGMLLDAGRYYGRLYHRARNAAP